MIPKEIFQKVHRIQITTSRLVTDVFAGEYHSVFKGLGIEFDEVREYQIGDDIRTIDWNVTARTGHPHVKKFVEERELTVMLLVDASMSCRFGTVRDLKSKLAAEIAAVLAFSAIKNNDKVGLIIFTNGVEKFIPPRKGTQHVLRVIREVLYFAPQNPLTDISNALEFLSKVTTRKTVTFIISDFLETNALSKNDLFAQASFRKSMAIANKRHDLIAITLNDPRETQLPNCGLIAFEDAESGEVLMMDSSNSRLRENYQKKAMTRLKNRDLLFSSIGMDHIDVSTGSPYTDELVKFFLKRRKRRI